MIDTEPNIKRKNQSPFRVIVNAWGCALSVVMLLAGTLLGLTIAVLYAPTLFSYEATETALAVQQDAIIATDVELRQRESMLRQQATDSVRDALATDFALDNVAALLNQTATQSQRYLVATQTADAVQNAQRRTQIALDFAATQSAIEMISTEAQRNRQATQAALDGARGFDAPAQAVAAAPLLASPTLTRTPIPTATFLPPPSNTPLFTETSEPIFAAQSAATERPTATNPPLGMGNNILLPPSDTPTRTPQSLAVTFDFEQVWTDEWQTFSTDDWTGTNEGILAERNDAWIISYESYASPYVLDFTISPAMRLNNEYFMLFQVSDTIGLAVHMIVDALAPRQLSVYRFDAALLDDQLSTSAMTELENIMLDDAVELRAETQFTITVDDETISVGVNDATLLLVDKPVEFRQGRVGLQVPEGTIIRDIQLRPN